MSHNTWRRWVTRLFQQQRQQRLRVRARRRLDIETLEERVVPATFVWSGLGANGNWSLGSNWVGNVAPGAGSDVVFSSATAPIKATVDNIGLAAGSGFASISFSAQGYSIATSSTNKLVVTGAINATANLGIVPATEPVITATLQLAPPSSNPQQTVTVGADTTIDISGVVSGTSGAQTLYKAGVGTLELDAANTAYTGAINLSSNGGIVLVTNSDALGLGKAVAGDPNAGITTVNANAQLQVLGSGLNIPENLILNGPGFINDGAILNGTGSGNNTWSGLVQLDSNSSFGANTGNLTFTNTIGDLGAGFSATKVGYATVTFATADTYRGQTIVNNGILAIENPLSLGAGANSTTIQSGSPASETIVNYNGPAQTFGTLELKYVPGTISSTDPNALFANQALPYNATTNPIVGFQVFNDILVLNGPGADPNAPGGGSQGIGNAADHLGAIYNLSGKNGWDGNVTLGSLTSSTADPVDPLPSGAERNDVFLGAAAGSSLSISGVVSEPNASTPLLDKVQPGRVILTNANTYTGIELYDYGTGSKVLTGTEVDQGDLMITDSKALGSSAVVVENMFGWPQDVATLELGVDSGLDGTSQRTHNRNLGFDSVTGSGQGVTGTGTGSGQEIYIPGSSGTSSSGTFTLTFEGQTTGSLQYNVSATALASALNSLSDVTAAGGVTVTQDGNVYRVIFGKSTSPNVPLLTINTTIANAAVSPIYGLIVANPITIAGTGYDDEGALANVSGINTYTGSIQVGNAFQLEQDPAYIYDLSGSIGSSLDVRPGHATADNSYTVFDYKLTIPNQNQISDISYQLWTAATDVFGPVQYTTFYKFGLGQLVVAQSNNNDTLQTNNPISLFIAPHNYTSAIGDVNAISYVPGPTVIAQGWITVEANDALGGADVNPLLSELIQPDSITVDSGASLQLLPASGSSITLANNLILSGTGLPATSLSTAGINFNILTEGAILSLSGENLLTGTIELDGVAGIGVDDPLQADAAFPSLSNLSVTGEIENDGSTAGGIEKLGSRELIVEGPGTYTGGDTVESGTFLLQNNTGLGEETSGTGLAANAFEKYSQTSTTVAVGGLLELGNTDPTTNGGIATGVGVLDEQLNLSGGGQQLNISGSGGTFTLSYTNPNSNTTDTTAAINVASTTLASDIQSALDALANLGGAGGSVTVTANAGITGLFTVVFNGALAAIFNPLLVATPAAAPSNATVTVSGSPYPLEALKYNVWNGPVELNANSTIEVANNALLKIQGVVEDTGIAAASGATLSLNTPQSSTVPSLDNGQLVLSGSNTYRGTTYINAGILTVANDQALGGTGSPEVQNVAISGTTGTFTLTFDGYTTSPLNVNSLTLASDMQTQLDALLSIGGVGGSVSVVKSQTLPNTYVVTFGGGSLTGFPQATMTATAVTGLPAVAVTEAQAGFGGTIVESGAQLQVEGNLTIAGEALELNGLGQTSANNPSTIPVSWEAVGPAPINDGQTQGFNAVTGRVTGVATDPSDPNVIYISTAGGGAWRTINGGLTWTQLFDGIPEIQNISVNPTTTSDPIPLTFNGQTATVNGDSQTLAQDIQTALNGLSTIGGIGGTVQVTQVGNVYSVSFGGIMLGSPENLITTTNGGVTISQLQAGVNANVALFSGAIAVDPENVDTIYLGTGEADNSGDSYYGTGVYVSHDYGGTWSLLSGEIFDPSDTGKSGNPIAGGAVSRIVVDPDHENTIYVSVSDNAVFDNNTGNAGVWRWSTNSASPDIGWTDLTSLVSILRNEGATIPGSSPLASTDNPALGILDIELLLDKEKGVDPQGLLPPKVYDTVNLGVNYFGYGGTGYVVENLTPGEYATAININALPSAYGYLYDPITDSGFPAYAPGTAGPDDNWNVTFPTSGVYSDLSFGQTELPLLDLVFDATKSGYEIDNTSQNSANNVPALFVALGDPSGLDNPLYGYYDSVYRLVDPFDASEAAGGLSTVWDIGDGNNWSVSSQTWGVPPPATLSITYDSGDIPTSTTSVGAFPLPGDYGVDAALDPLPDTGNLKITSSGLTEYASITWATTNALLQGDAAFQYLLVSTNGGLSWGLTSGQPQNYESGQGWYDSSIVASQTNPKEFFLTGDITNGTQVLESTDGGATFTDISVDANGNGPHTDEHATAIDANGNLIAGNDGGVWEYNTTTDLWTDVNGNLAITTENGVSSAPGNPQEILSASQDNGTELSNPSNGEAWQHVDSGDGGEVFYDPQNPLIAYHVINDGLQKSTDGGQTWSSVPITLTEPLYFSFVLDSLNSNRVVVGGSGLIESLNGGTTWENLAPPAENVSALALATYQGEGPKGSFLPDPAFPDVTDQGANTYDPNTIYITGIDPATGSQGFWVTKDDGLNWSPDRVSGMKLSGGSIQAIAVDPLDRDNVFAVIQASPGGQNEVLESQNAGLTWTNITKASITAGDLPNTPFWTLTIDPRTETLYLGTNVGVYSASMNTAKPATTSWSRFGIGLPNVEVTQISLDTSTNTLTAGTYGRSVFQINLYDPVALSGALRDVSGISVWTGPIRLVGNTSIDVDGIQNIPLGEAQLNIQGIISDSVYGTDSSLTKIGVGTLIFTGANAYGGPTTVADGVLVANNYTALGTNTTIGTTVDVGASLELSADLDNVPVTLFGNGIVFNDHNTGALRNVSGNNTFYGDLILDGTSPTAVTIGADSGSELTLDGQIEGASGIDLIKEETGTIALDNTSTANPNDYAGNTYVYQGALQAETSNAFSSGTVETLDGAQVQVQATPDIQTLTVNATTGTFTLTYTGPNSSGTVVSDTTPSLNVTSQTLLEDIQNALNALLNIGGVGGSVTVTYLSSNVYSLLFGGTLYGEPLNTLKVNNLVQSGGGITAATLQLGGSINVPNGLVLSGTGIFNTGALLNTGGNNTWSGPITFTVLPNFSPFSTPLGIVAIGSDQGDTLTIGSPTSGGIADQTANVPTELLKVDAGIVDLPSANTYTGTTVVADGTLNVQNDSALGSRPTSSPNLNTIQQIETLDAQSTASAMFTLSFDGFSSQFKWGTSAAKIKSAFDTAGTGLFAQAGIVGATVAVTRTNVETTSDAAEPAVTAPKQGFIYTVTFQGTANTTTIPILATGLDGVITDAAIVSAGKVDVLVDAGGELALDDSAAGTPLSLAANIKLTLNGDGPTSGTLDGNADDGAFFNYQGNNTFNGSIELPTAAQVGVAATTSLSLTGKTTSDAPFFEPTTDSLEKVDAGTLIFTSTSSYAGYTIVTGGDLQSDSTAGVGTYAGVVLDGGTLSGNGTVGLISSNSPLSGNAGSIDSGDNFPTEAIGTLTSNGSSSPVFTKQDVLNPDDTVYVDIGPHGSSSVDFLNVSNAGIDLGGATLTGLVDPTVSQGDTYTIIETDGVGSDTVVGTFAGATTTPQYGGNSATVVWIGNEKFEVDYFADKVTITRELATVTLNLTATANTPVYYGQNEQFVAALVPEVDAPPVTGTVVFTVTGPSGTNNYSVTINPATGVATLNTSSTPNFLPEPLAVGQYTVTASYNGDNSSGVLTYNPVVNQTLTTPPTVVPAGTVTVGPAPTKIAISPSDPQPVFGETLTLTATVSTGVTAPVAGTAAPSGTVYFFDNGGATLLGTATLSGTGTLGIASTTFNIATLSVGTHELTADYSFGDGNYQASFSTQLTLIVNEDPTKTTISASPIDSVYGQAVTFTADVSAVSPGSGHPTGTVSFERILSGGVLIVMGTGTLSTTGGITSATYTTTAGQLPVTGSSGIVITALYNGDGNYETSTGQTNTVSSPPIVVTQDGSTTTVLPSSSNPSVYGQTVTFTARVAAAAPGGGNPTGTVQFFLNGGATPIGSGTLITSGGVTTASFTTASFQLPVSPTALSITAKYLGDGNFFGSSSSSYLQVVNKDATATTESSSSDPSVFGQQVTFTAVVAASSPGAGTPTGTVTFTDTTTNLVLGTGSLAIVNGVDEATYTTAASQLTLGNGQTITATYSGDGDFLTSGNSLSQSVGADATSTSLASNIPAGSVYGQPVTFTATVKASAPGSGTPTGTVTFMDGSIVLASGISLSNGVAMYTTAAGQLTVGNNAISAVYTSTTPDFVGSTGNLNQVVNQDSTATSVSSSGPSVLGNPVLFIATVNANSPGAGTPTGTVTFYVTEGSTLVKLGTGTLSASGSNSSTASYTTTASQLVVGTNQIITAVYSGDTDFLTSTGTTTQTVSRGLATVAVTSTWSDAPTPVVYGQSVTFSAAVVPTAGSISPTGTVTFTEGGTTLASNVPLTLVNGVETASFTTSPLQLPEGLNQSIVASYSGDSNYQPANGSELQSVNADPTSTALTASSTTANVGQAVVFSATVRSTSPGSGVPAGVVSFKNTATNQLLGSSTIVAGVATFQTTFGTAGTPTIQAIYNGNTDYITSTSVALPITVTAVGTRVSKVTVVSSLNPSELGQSVTFTATVKDGGTGKVQTPTGLVSFFDGTTLIGIATLSTTNSVTTAAFTTSTLPLGSNSIVAVYDGNATFALEKSTALIQTVNPVPNRSSTIALKSSSFFNNSTGAYTSSYGQNVTFTATVTDTGSAPAVTPGGTVTFYYETPGSSTLHQLGTGTLSGTGTNATATYSTASLAVGDYTIVAVYGGNSVFLADSPASISQNVTQIATTTTVASSSTANTSVFGQSVTFTAKVIQTGGAVATGSVVFTDQTTGAVLGTVALTAGTATIKTSTLDVESHTIVASYAGTANIAASSGNVVQVVNQDNVTLGLALSTTNSNVSLTLTSTAKAALPGAGTPTGTMSFYIDGIFEGTVTVGAGKAALTLPGGVSSGNHTLTIVYSGDNDFASNSFSEVVNFSQGRNT